MGLSYVKIKFDGPKDAWKKSAYNRLLRDVMEFVGTYWHRQFMPIHFTLAAYRRYNYTPRAGETGDPRGNKWMGKRFWSSYTGRKVKVHKHRKPLVLTGESEQSAKTNFTIRATRKVVRVSMRTPRLNYRPRNSAVNMANELRTVTLQEAQILGEQAHLEFEALVKERQFLSASKGGLVRQKRIRTRRT